MLWYLYWIVAHVINNQPPEFVEVWLICNFQHYEQDSDGLCTKLVKPLQKKGQFEFTVDPDELVRQGWAIKIRDLKMGEIIGRGDFGGKVVGKNNFGGFGVNEN